MFSKHLGASGKKIISGATKQKQLLSFTSRFTSNDINESKLEDFRKPIPGNPFNSYIREHGDRPLFLQKKMYKANKRSLWTIGFAVVPLIVGYLVVDALTNQDQEKGVYPPLDEFEKHRNERKAALAQLRKDEEELARLEAEVTGKKVEPKEEKANKNILEPFVMDFKGTPVLVVPPGAKIPENNTAQVVNVGSAVQEGRPSEPINTIYAGSATKEDVRHVKYVLVGGGTASYYAMEAIKKNDPNGEVLILSDEQHVPYPRPPLSKELWKSNDANNLKYLDWMGKERKLEYKPLEAYQKSKVMLKTQTKVVKLDADEQSITTSDGTKYKYDKLLLATGGSAIIIPGMENIPNEAMTFRTIDDFAKLNKITQDESEKDIVIVGGSFLGTELAYSIASTRKGAKVTQIYLEPEVLSRNLPRFLTKEVSQLLASNGVKLQPNRQVLAVFKRPDGKISVKLDGGQEIVTDYVLSAIGIYPNTEIAEASGLEIDPIKGGIMANSELEARSNIYVAGDVLSYYDTLLGRRRSEHYEHAVSTGRVAGQNMSSGSSHKYNHLSMFWSDVGPLGFEAVGEISSNLQTFSIWDGVEITQNGAPWYDAPAPTSSRGFTRGIVYYLKDQKVVGVLLWNVRGKVDEARKVIASNVKYSDVSDLKDKIKIPPHSQKQ